MYCVYIYKSEQQTVGEIKKKFIRLSYPNHQKIQNMKLIETKKVQKVNMVHIVLFLGACCVKISLSKCYNLLI